MNDRSIGACGTEVPLCYLDLLSEGKHRRKPTIMRTLRCAVVLVAILVAALGMATLAEAEVFGPLCSHIAGGPLSINVRVFAVPTGENQFLLTGVELGPPVRPLSGSSVIVGNTSVFQFTLSAISNVPTLFISGEVDNGTGNGNGLCARNVQTNAGCGEGIAVILTKIDC